MFSLSITILWFFSSETRKISIIRANRTRNDTKNDSFVDSEYENVINLESIFNEKKREIHDLKRNLSTNRDQFHSSFPPNTTSTTHHRPYFETENELETSSNCRIPSKSQSNTTSKQTENVKFCNEIETKFNLKIGSSLNSCFGFCSHSEIETITVRGGGDVFNDEYDKKPNENETDFEKMSDPKCVLFESNELNSTSHPTQKTENDHIKHIESPFIFTQKTVKVRNENDGNSVTSHSFLAHSKDETHRICGVRDLFHDEYDPNFMFIPSPKKENINTKWTDFYVILEQKMGHFGYENNINSVTFNAFSPYSDDEILCIQAGGHLFDDEIKQKLKKNKIKSMMNHHYFYDFTSSEIGHFVSRFYETPTLKMAANHIEIPRINDLPHFETKSSSIPSIISTIHSLSNLKQSETESPSIYIINIIDFTQIFDQKLVEIDGLRLISSDFEDDQDVNNDIDDPFDADFESHFEQRLGSKHGHSHDFEQEQFEFMPTFKALKSSLI